MANPSFASYEKTAKEAVRYVKQVLPHGAYNHPGELFARLFFFGLPRQQISKHRQDEAWDRIDVELAGLQTHTELTDNQRSLAAIDIWAKNALMAQAGNCQLQAAVAFTWLRDQGMYPLDYAVILNSDGDKFKHAFVVMGRPANLDFSQFAQWQSDAMLCDPWRDAVGFAAMLKIWYPNAIYRLYARQDGPAPKKAA
jgi:hypothetical protein